MNVYYKVNFSKVIKEGDKSNTIMYRPNAIALGTKTGRRFYGEFSDSSAYVGHATDSFKYGIDAFKADNPYLTVVYAKHGDLNKLIIKWLEDVSCGPNVQFIGDGTNGGAYGFCMLMDILSKNRGTNRLVVSKSMYDINQMIFDRDFMDLDILPEKLARPGIYEVYSHMDRTEIASCMNGEQSRYPKGSALYDIDIMHTIYSYICRDRVNKKFGMTGLTTA